MKYHSQPFNSAVRYYQRNLKRFKSRNFLVVFNPENPKAFYSIAPLSRAAHNLGKDLHVMAKQGTHHTYRVLKELWESHHKIKANQHSGKEGTLKRFIDFLDKKSQGKLGKLFAKPVILEQKGNRFICQDCAPEFKPGWYTPYRRKKLLKTCNILWDQLYHLRKKESVQVRFELIPAAKDMKKPVEDYLDSFVIARAMYDTVKGRCGKCWLNAYTSRESVLEPRERTGDLKTTLLGCELSKQVEEPVFRKFRAISQKFRINLIEIPTAVFAISGKGYGGKHLFGRLFGYPTPNRKSRWLSPGEMLYKFNWFPQSRHESRPPRCRIGFTQTIPIDQFIRTCHINWLDMAAKDRKLAQAVNQCSRIYVKSNLSTGGSDFVVDLVDSRGNRRIPKKSDVEIRNRYDKGFYKQTGIKCGTMSNIPGGEVFVTPESINGTVVGDMVVAIDESYPLSEKRQMVIECHHGKYSLVRAPRDIKKVLQQKKKESWNQLRHQEKLKGIPKSIIKTKKRNFNQIGEFAINTNPRARFSGYLIIDEKIAGMMHVALGAGFDSDRTSEYHYDIVLNCKRQKMDIYGITGSGHQVWFLRKGRFVL